MKFSIKSKIFLGLGFLFSVILLLGFLGSYYLRTLSQETGRVLEDNLQSLDYADHMLRSLDQFADGDTLALARFNTYLNSQEKNVTEPGERSATAEIRERFQQLYTLAQPGISAESARLVGEMKESINVVNELNKQALARKNSDARDSARKAMLYMTVIGAICLLVSFTLLLNFPGYIADPIQKLTRSIKQVADRNYRERLHFKSGDEFGELATAFNTMAERLDAYEHSNLARIQFEKKRIETIIRSMHDAIIGLDEKGIILFANPSVLQLLGMKEEELLGKYAPDVALKNDLLRSLVQENQGKELKIYAGDKESYFTKEMLQVTLTEDNGEQLLGKVIVLKNITHFHELDEAKTHFIATLSHELKTPISAIKLSVQLLDDSRIGELNTEQKQLLGNIRDDAARLLRITGELLDMAKVETGNINFNLRPAHAPGLVNYAVQAMQFTAQQQEVILETDIAPGIPDILADAEKSTWVLTNLVSNAIRYSPKGGKVLISVSRNDKEAVFSVKDEGKGIDPRYATRIFERYFQVPGSDRQSSGTGLGLAISKEFIEVQGGTIKLESAWGEGSTFIFTLPLAPEK